MEHKKPIIVSIVAVAILVVIAAMVWYSGGRRGERPAPPSATQPPAGGEIVAPDLGSTLYEDAKNPIGDKLPESAAPVPNPIEGIYKNPFE